MPSPRVQRREPLHNIWALIGYGIAQINDLVLAIRYVIVVDITVTKRDRVRIRCVVHGVSKVLIERRYATGIDNPDEVLWNMNQQG